MTLDYSLPRPLVEGDDVVLSERIEKPWGWEILWARTPHYCGKTIAVHAGKRLSLQYHDDKTESQTLIRGRALLLLEDADGVMREIEMHLGVGYTILPYRRHRLVAITDIEVIEVSTPECGTTFRLHDDYARPHETEEVRARPGRV